MTPTHAGFIGVVEVNVRVSAAIVLALLVAAPASAQSGVDLEALRAFFERVDGTYATDEVADLVLAYRTTGASTTLTDLRVEVRLEDRTGATQRQAFRLREALVPEPEHHFHVPLDIASLRLAEGSWRVTMKIDSDDRVRETTESNNTATAGLLIRGAAQPPSAPRQRELEPISARVVARAAGSPFEREWTSPLEVGLHPGYGLAAAVLKFEHPERGLGYGQSVSRVTLRLRGSTVGAPVEQLGRLVAHVRPLPAPTARCTVVDPQGVPVSWSGGEAAVDLTTMVMQDERAESGRGCNDTLEVLLAFERQPQARGTDGHLMRIDFRGATLDVETRSAR